MAKQYIDLHELDNQIQWLASEPNPSEEAYGIEIFLSYLRLTLQEGGKILLEAQ